jgi:hypothetical protein
MPSLAHHMMIIDGVQRTACVLGVHEDILCIKVAWKAVVGARGVGRDYLYDSSLCLWAYA